MTFLEQIIELILSFFRGTPIVRAGDSGTPSDNEQVPRSGNRHLVTIPEHVTASFYDTGSGAWIGQWKGTPMEGKHGGTDYAAPSGTPVYAPYSMKVIAIAYYPDSGKRGWYVIGTLPDGAEYYSGHLNNILVKRGDLIESGQQLGQTWDWWGEAGRAHTHIQIKVRGAIVDPEKYFREH